MAAASKVGGNKPANYFCVTAASAASSTSNLSSSAVEDGPAPQIGELDTGTDTILVDMCHDIPEPKLAENARNHVQKIVKSSLCGDQKYIL